MNKLFFYFILLLGIGSTACKQTNKTETKEVVIIRERNDAATLNPVAGTDQLSMYAGSHIFQSLTNIDYKTEKPTGVLAKTPPVIKIDSLGRMLATYTLKNEATFSNDKKVSVDDVIFSMKVNFCPLVNNSNGINYYYFIENISIDNDSTVTVICSNGAVLNQLRSGDFFILPRSHYDSLNYLQNFSLLRLKTEKGLESNDSIIQFSKAFNQSLTSTNPNAYVGSGAYQLDQWQKGERIILKKVKNWWGKKYESDNTFFKANPKSIQFEIINDNQTAISALKAGEIDVVNYVNQNDFEKIKSNEKIKTAICLQHGYNYIGFNCNHRILKNKKFRKAIEVAIPYSKIVDVVYNNQATLNRLPLAVQQKHLRNNSLEFESQNLIRAKEMLQELGWVDLDKDGILDLKSEDEVISCELSYHYNSGNAQRKAVGILLKNELKKIGIKLTIKELEWVTYLKALKAGEAQLFMSGKLTLPITPDFTNSLHSSSANGGRNYANYQNAQLDTIIETILNEIDAEKRTNLIKKLQKIVAEDAPYIYLCSTKNRFAHSAQLKNVPVYSLRPHFWAAELH